MMGEIMEEYDLDAAHNASTFNKDIVLDTKCGCFHCLEIFSPSEIEEWCCEVEDGEEVTAICPHCGIDSVIGESSGFPISRDFLQLMRQKWFGPYENI